MRAAVIAIIAGCLPLGAYAHQGFANASNGPVTRIAASIASTTYDGAIWVDRDGELVQIILGNPASLKARGLPLSSLTAGKQVIVDAYDRGSDDSTLLYAKRIAVDGRVVDLR